MKQVAFAALALSAFLPPAARADAHAKNVILFLADAAGIPTINAASRYGYNAPGRLFVQHLPFIGLSETSTASEWVTDSAAGMTAIVTGQKTHNGVIAEGPDAVRGQKDGASLKTLLDYGEEHGLSTGIISNDSIAGATPAALYAHANRHGQRPRRFGRGKRAHDLSVAVGRSCRRRPRVCLHRHR